MFKNMMIKMVLPMVFDTLISTLGDLARKSDNKLDDKMVRTILDNRDKILEDIKKKLS